MNCYIKRKGRKKFFNLAVTSIESSTIGAYINFILDPEIILVLEKFRDKRAVVQIGLEGANETQLLLMEGWISGEMSPNFYINQPVEVGFSFRQKEQVRRFEWRLIELSN